MLEEPKINQVRCQYMSLNTWTSRKCLLQKISQHRKGPRPHWRLFLEKTVWMTRSSGHPQTPALQTSSYTASSSARDRAVSPPFLSEGSCPLLPHGAGHCPEGLSRGVGLGERGLKGVRRWGERKGLEERGRERERRGKKG